MGLFNLFKPAKTVLVVDAVSLNESLGMKGKVPPRNQLQMLRRLARFAQREKIELIAILTGAPLNKAPVGKKFEGVTVLYSKSPDKHAKFMAKITMSKGSGAIMVSGSAAFEKAAGNGVNKMRVSTFRKAFDTGGEGEGGGERGERGEGGSRGRNSNRPRRDRPRKKGNSENNGGGNNVPRQERKPKESSESDASTDGAETDDKKD